jgi:hypothetical protein
MCVRRFMRNASSGSRDVSRAPLTFMGVRGLGEVGELM